jgi:hypothetical protein
MHIDGPGIVGPNDQEPVERLKLPPGNVYEWPRPGARRSRPERVVRGRELYGNAFSSEARACFRRVHEPSTSRPIIDTDTLSWDGDHSGLVAGRWRLLVGVDAGGEHASHLSPTQPRPGARFGLSRPPFQAGGRRQTAGRRLL